MAISRLDLRRSHVVSPTCPLLPLPSLGEHAQLGLLVQEGRQTHGEDMAQLSPDNHMGETVIVLGTEFWSVFIQL